MNRRLLSIGLALLIAIGGGAALMAPHYVWHRARIAIEPPRFPRLLGINTTTATRRPVACPSRPFVILVLGQSNAANYVQPLHIVPAAGVYNFFDGHCYAARDPMLGASGWRSSLWPMTAAQVAAATGRAVVVISAAIGGSMVSDWVDASTTIAGRAHAAAMAWRSTGGRVDTVVWYQGEEDTANGTTQADYREQLRRVLRSFPAQHTVIVQASRCYGRSSDAVRAAQVEVARDIAGGIVGPDADTIAGRDDGCHLTWAGAAQLSRMLTPVLVKTARR